MTHGVACSAPSWKTYLVEVAFATMKDAMAIGILTNVAAAFTINP